MPPAVTAQRKATSVRFGDLDALRATAMTLGIAYHAALPWMPYAWYDREGMEAVQMGTAFLHGFRMPLFFLISGFFTAMLLSRRGISGMLKQRLTRIGLPLAVALVTFLPLLWVTIWFVTLLGTGESVFPSPTEYELAHLWFLWQLLILAAVYAGIVALGRLARRTVLPPVRLRRWMLIAAMAAVAAAIVLPEGHMTENALGPDTSGGFIPAPHVLTYYLLYFLIGALAFEGSRRFRADFLQRLGRLWLPLLAVGTLVLFPWALRSNDAGTDDAALAQTLMTLTLCLGFIGLFHRFLARERRWIRIYSDASYFMYLAHMPLVLLAQALVMKTKWPALVEVTIMSVTVAATLFLVYRYVVRYRALGTLLNGKRTREGDAVLASAP